MRSLDAPTAKSSTPWLPQSNTFGEIMLNGEVGVTISMLRPSLMIAPTSLSNSKSLSTYLVCWWDLHVSSWVRTCAYSSALEEMNDGISPPWDSRAFLVQKFSMTGWRYVNVTMLSEMACIIRATNLRETKSREHKIKISSIMISALGTIGDQNAIQATARTREVAAIKKTSPEILRGKRRYRRYAALKLLNYVSTIHLSAFEDFCRSDDTHNLHTLTHAHPVFL